MIGRVPVVATTMGRVRGRGLPNAVAVFAGVPFARPPVGTLRWRPPQLPAEWSDVLDCQAFAPAPPQPAALGTATPERAEDCLRLNVWTPGLAGTRPVLVWFFGGGFEIGSASPPYTDASALARRTGAVVVAAAYRLGALGWLLAGHRDADYAETVNLGLRDQIAALHWVRRNIAAFGGDPDNVTVGGHAAGADAVGALLAAPAAAGTFQKALLSSGSGRTVEPAVAAAMTEDFLQRLGASGVGDLVDTPVDRIVAAQRAVAEPEAGARHLPGGRAWCPVHGNPVLPDQPAVAVRRGRARHIPLLLSTVRDEAKAFEWMPGFAPAERRALLADMRVAGFEQPEQLLSAYRAARPHANLTELRTRFLTDAVYRMPALRLAGAQAAAGGRAHVALFAAEAAPDMGVPHGIDVIFAFDRLAIAGLADPRNIGVGDELIAAWRAFLHTGDPGWPGYRDGVRRFGADGGMIVEPGDDEVSRLWLTRAGHN